MAQTPTVEDLGKKVKAKYPGSYDDLPDADLGRKVKTKYPGSYDDFADIQAKPQTSALPPTPTLRSRVTTAMNTGTTGKIVDALADVGMSFDPRRNPVLTQPLSKSLGGYSAHEAVERLLPEDPKQLSKYLRSGFAYDVTRRGARTIGGLFDWLQTPLGIATSIAHATSEGATAVLAPLLGAKFGSDAMVEGRAALEDMEKNGATPENVEQYLGAWSMGLFGVGGLKAGVKAAKPRPEVKIPTKSELARIAEETNRVKSKQGVRLARQARKAKEAAERRAVVQQGKAKAAQRVPSSQKTVTANPPALIEGKPRDPFDVATEEARTAIEDDRKRAEEQRQRAQESELKVTDRRRVSSGEPEEQVSGAVAKVSQEKLKSTSTLPPLPELKSRPAETSAPEPSTTQSLYSDLGRIRQLPAKQKQGKASASELTRYVSELSEAATKHMPKDEALAESLDKATVALGEGNRGLASKHAETARGILRKEYGERLARDNAKKLGIEREYREKEEARKKTINDKQRTKKAQTKTKTEALPPTPTRSASPFQRLVDGHVDTVLQQIVDLQEDGATEMTGKAKREVSGSGEQGKVVGRHGGGFKEMFPFLDGEGSPSQIVEAIRRDKNNPTFLRIRERVAQWVTENHGEDIQAFLDVAKPEELDELFRQEETAGELFGEGGGGKGAATALPSKAMDSAGSGHQTAATRQRGTPTTVGEPTIPPAQIPGSPFGVKARISNTVNAVRGIATSFKRIFLPASLPGGREAKLATRANVASMRRAVDQARSQLLPFRDYFDRKTPQEMIGFWEALDGRRDPRTLPQAEQEALAAYLKVNDEIRQQVAAVKPAAGRIWLENYGARYWDKPSSAAQTQIQALDRPPQGQGKPPLMGSKGFLKGRIRGDDGEPLSFREMLDLGFKPRNDNYNPIDHLLWKTKEMMKFVAGNKIKEDVLQWVPGAKFRFGTAKPSEGFAYIDDPAFTVFGSPHIELHEAYDEVLFTQLNEFARNLGIDHFREVNSGGRWGYTRKGSNTVYTKFGGPETVLTHEIGHQLDFKYGLKDRLTRRGETAKELRALADERYRNRTVSPAFKKYVREGSEKIANLVHAFVHTPEFLHQIAPHSEQALRETIMMHPELQPLLEIKPSLVLGTNKAEIKIPGLRIIGRYEVPDGAAQLINNYLKTGFLDNRGGFSDLIRGFYNLGQVSLQFKLGLSGFHGGTTALNSIVSKVALAQDKIATGNYRGAAKDLALSPFAWFTDAPLGRALQKEWNFPGTGTPEIQELVKMIEKGGGSIGLPPDFRTEFTRNMKRLWYAGHPFQAALRVPFAFMEKSMSPLMEHYVPWLKYSASAQMVPQELQRLGANPTEMQLREAMASVSDSVDNRFGELVYDNLFWNKTAKQLAMMGLLSLGWQLGTWREVGGGMADTIKALPRLATGNRALTSKLSHNLALVLVHGAVSALYQYIHNPQLPLDQYQSKDFWRPRNGQTDAKTGTPMRVTPPDYVGRDIYSLVTVGPVQAGMDKLHPQIKTVFDLMRNKDFWNVQIRDEDDTALNQFIQVGEYLGKQLYEPISFSNLDRMSSPDQTARRRALNFAESFVGFVPSSKSSERTPAERLASEYRSRSLPSGGMTRAQSNKTKLLSDLRFAIKNDAPDARARVDEAFRSKQITITDEKNLFRNAKQSYLQHAVSRLGLEQALDVWEQANAAERSEIKTDILKKANNLRERLGGLDKEMEKRLHDVRDFQRSSTLPPMPQLNTPMR